MKKPIATIVLILALTCGLVSIVAVKALAQSVGHSDAQVTIIKDNCVTIKSNLNQLHASDALLRVNMGQLYESMLTKLMDKFNSRLSDNHYDNSSFVFVAGGYSSTLNAFRTDYIDYEKQLSSTIAIDCASHPNDFYSAVSSARAKRNQVRSDVVKLNQYLDNYETAVNGFEINYQATHTEAVK
ncbi:hypothetical protein HGB24_01235 [Candidatus Saccharibacteria bacterium]|nr:hypothetical protein [Candidatus Saccharibacteria bacterium]